VQDIRIQLHFCIKQGDHFFFTFSWAPCMYMQNIYKVSKKISFGREGNFLTIFFVHRENNRFSWQNIHPIPFFYDHFNLQTLIPSHSWCSPRHKTKVGANHDWGLGLDKSSVNLDNKVSHDSDDEDPNVQNMLKENDSPAIRALMNDQLFLRHLELFLEKPNQKTFHELKNRAKTLRRRRTDAASTRFFLRD